ncbi:MAG: glycosyltransferase [Armatimonadetes bacterium]|nr:glycosyltransferase [Armatimonadota bacterium]
MKIVYAALMHDYMVPERGYSFEHQTFYDALRAMPGVHLVYVPYDRMLEVGRDRMNDEMVALAAREKPDLFWAVMFTDELRPDALRAVGALTTTLAWMCDDHWRFDSYSRRCAPHFHWIATTYSRAVARYHALGCRNVIHTQWAANTRLFRPLPVARDIDASFVGSYSKPRARLIEALRRAGVKVVVRGTGWPEGRVSGEELVRIFSASKVGLALNPPSSYLGVRSLGRLFLRRSGTRLVADVHHLPGNVRELLQRRIPQIKARVFELAACGALAVTADADNLGDYYDVGREVVVYRNADDLVDRVRHLLAHDGDREAIARAGYERTVRDHTYERRFGEILRRVTAA